MTQVGGDRARIGAVVCVSTEQQISNVLPILEVRPERVFDMTTSLAGKQGWHERLVSAVAPIPVSRVDIGEEVETSPSAIRDRVLASLAPCRPEERAMILAWGGGQKPASAGLWQAFDHLSRAYPEVGHQAVYVEQHRGTLLRWSHSEGSPRQEALEASLSLEQVMASAGIERTQKPFVRVWPEADPFPGWLPEAYGLFHMHPEYRRMCFESAAVNQIPMAGLSGLTNQQSRALIEALFRANLPNAVYDDLIDELIATIPPLANNVNNRFRNGAMRLRRQIRERLGATAPPSVAPPADRAVEDFLRRANGGRLPDEGLSLVPDAALRFPRILEWLVVHRVRQWAEANEGLVLEIRANLECQRVGGRNVVAEFDIAILQRSGRLVIMDAKSFTQDAGSRRAQEMSVQYVGGSFAKRYVTLPMYCADIGQPDRRTDPAGWGAVDWYPNEVLAQIANWRADQVEFPRDVMALIPFNETGAFEAELSRLCR